MEENKTDIQEKTAKAPNTLKPLLILILILIVGFAGFVTYKPQLIAAAHTQAPEPTENAVSVGSEFAATEDVATLDIDYDKIYALHNPEDIVYKSGEVEISWEDYYYFYKAVLQENLYYLNPSVNFTDEIEGVGINYNDFFASAAEDTLDYYISMYLMAKDSGVTDQDVQSDMNTLTNTYLANYGVETEEELYKLLNEEFGVSKDVFNLINKATVYSSKLFANTFGKDLEKVDANEALEMIKEKNYYNVQHILFSCYDMEKYEKLDDESFAVKKEKAQEIADELNAIVDNEARAKKFKEYAAQYNDDSNTQYCVTEGTMVTEFDNAAKELNDYEIAVVETEYGCHIIQKLPLDVNVTLQDVGMTPLESLANNKFIEMMEKYRDEMQSGRTEILEVPDLNEFKK